MQNLTVILDAVKSHWEVQRNAFIDASTQSITLEVVISAIKALESALKMQHSENTMEVYVSVGPTVIDQTLEGCKIVCGSVWKAAAQALCRINALKTSSRLLIIQKSSENNEQDAALNLMIAAQQLKVEIDGLALGDCEVLAKTSAFSGGVFFRQSNLGILQTLLQVYLPVNRPKTPILHFKPYCTCCKKKVDRAYVCTFCLAIYCVLQPNCSVCQSRLIIPEIIH